MLQATLVASGLAVAYHFAHPDSEWVQLPVIALVMGIWIASLFLLADHPPLSLAPHPAHRPLGVPGLAPALRRRGRGSARSSPASAAALRAAVVDRLPAQALVPSVAEQADGEPAEAILGAGANSDSSSEGARLVRLLRQAGNRGGVPVSEESELDAGISLFLFSDRPVAVRLAKMRELLSSGASAHDLRTLEDLRDDLARAPAEAWATRGRRAPRAAPARG